MKQINLDQLARCIEAILYSNPLYLDELKTILENIFQQEIDAEILTAVLAGLQDKYSEAFYGIEFCFINSYVFFKRRDINKILNR